MIAKSRIIAPLAAVLLLMFCAGGVLAQVTTTEILGTVTDPTGGVLQAVTVTIKNLDTNVTRSTITTETGSYLFALLPVGSYQLTVEAPGFKTYMVPEITLASGDRTRVDAVMEIGGVTETVEVSATSAGAVQTDSATVGSLITDTAVQDLPVNGRNFIRLVQLSPGANESVQWSLSAGNRSNDRRLHSGVSVNGMPDGQNNYLLDGMDNNERVIGTISMKPSIEALQEAKTTTSMYSAETGRAGGGVINMITKSGTNRFHGSGFWFGRHDALDAKDFFNVPQPGNPLAGAKPKYRQNQIGGSLGGPIFKDKTFFFADYERLSIVQGLTRSLKIPTACQLGREECNGVTQLGNFSDDTSAAYKSPITGDPLPNNIMPAAEINPVGTNFAALYPTLPKEACPDPANCLFINSPERTQYAHQGDVRVDHNFSGNDSLFARYSINDTFTTTPGWLPDGEVAGVSGIVSHGSGPAGGNFAGTTDQRAHNVAASFTHVFRPNLMLQINGQMTRFNTDSQPGNSDKGNLQDKFGGPAGVNSEFPGTGGLATVLFVAGGWSGVGDYGALPTVANNTAYQFTGNTIWSKSSHNIKFGASVIRRQWTKFEILFKSLMVMENSGSGNAMINLMSGVYTQVWRNMALTVPNYRAIELGFYFQDDWRATDWLTLNMGLRYDIFTPVTEKDNQMSNFDITRADVRARGEMSVAGQDGVSRSVNTKTQYNNFQPRLGFAATVSNSTVLRGGFGVSNFPGKTSFFMNAPFSMAARYSNLGLFGVPVPVNTMSDALPPIEPGPTCLSEKCGAPPRSSFEIANGATTDLKPARLYMWNLLLEQEMAGNVVSLGYVGTSGRNMARVRSNVNIPIPPNDPGGCGIYPVPASCQPYYDELPYVGTVQQHLSDGDMNYHAAQATFQRRFNRGLAMSANYTYGRALANTIGFWTGIGTGILDDKKSDYGNSPYDVRHRFTANANYELPFGRSLSGVAGSLLGGWQVNGIYLYSTGNPMTITNAEDIQGTNRYQGQALGNRPDWVPSQGSFKPSMEQWFDPNQFRRQPLGTAGNAPPFIMRMPRMTRVDFSVLKDFRITESATIQFRAEFFNLFNTPSFGQPPYRISGWSHPIGDPDARPTSAGGWGVIDKTNINYTPRDIQFALKILF